MEDLWRIVRSIRDAAAAAGVPVVTGDTKVVDRGKGDGVYINTTGIGRVGERVNVAPQRARPGDVVLLSGAIAVHGIAIMSVREGLEFETRLESDSASLHELVGGLLDRRAEDVHVLRDPTRGGVASALNEIAAQARVGIRLDEAAIPLDEEALQQRASALYDLDRGKTIRRSHDNPDIQRLYKEFLGRPLSEKSHELLHTHYKKHLPRGIVSPNLKIV